MRGLPTIGRGLPTIGKGGSVRADFDAHLINVLGSDHSIYAGWIINETAGVTCTDVKGGHNGTWRNTAGVITGATLGQPGFDRKKSCLFDGSGGVISGFGNLVAFDWSEFSVIVNQKIQSAAVWATTDWPETVRLATSTVNNLLKIGKYGAANNYWFDYKANGVEKAIVISPISTLDWFQTVLTVSHSADRMKGWLDGVPVNAGVTGLGLWSEATSVGLMLGADNATGGNGWKGWMQHVYVVTPPIWDAEVAAIAQPFFNGVWGGSDAVIASGGPKPYKAFPSLVEI